MAIQIVNLAVPNGDTPRSANTKINENFSNQDHAASRLIGTGHDQVPLGRYISSLAFSFVDETTASNASDFGFGNIFAGSSAAGTPDLHGGYSNIITIKGYISTAWQIAAPYAFSSSGMDFYIRPKVLNGVYGAWGKIYTSNNTTIVNGSLKPSSPVVKIHTDSLELNDDAERMGVTLNKRGVGDYLLQNTTGLRNDGGWRIELPQDVNGNPYFAVDYTELENNDIEVKTYKRIFDMNTFMFVPDLNNPVDIKNGRSIAIRFNDLPQEDLPPSEV